MAYTRIVLALALAGCVESRALLSEQGGDETSTLPAVDVEGVWDGDAYCGDSRYALELTLTQDGAEVTGMGAMDWLFWQFVADVEAMAAADELVGRFVSDDVEMRFDAEVNAVEMMGQIYAQGELCPSPVAFILTRQD